jgi:hypothetical protein
MVASPILFRPLQHPHLSSPVLTTCFLSRALSTPACISLFFNLDAAKNCPAGVRETVRQAAQLLDAPGAVSSVNEALCASRADDEADEIVADIDTALSILFVRRAKELRGEINMKEGDSCVCCCTA